MKGVFRYRSQGQEKENCDIDVLVEFLEGATLFDPVGLGNFLEENHTTKWTWFPREL